MGVTKPIYPEPLFSEFFSITKMHARYWISRSYMTDVTKNRWGTSAGSKILLTEKLTNRALVTPTPGDIIWHPKSWSTLVQVMVWCHGATSHYLNQLWLIISGILSRDMHKFDINQSSPRENKCSWWANGELTVSSRWPRLRDPIITAQSRLGEVTAQSRRDHSSVTARSQLSHV